MFNNWNVLIVDDSKPLLQMLSTILCDYEVGRIFAADDAETAIETVKAVSIDLIFCDYRMMAFWALSLYGWQEATATLPLVQYRLLH